MAQNRQLTAIIEREGDGYVALCPEVDIASQGNSIELARANLKEALELFFETADPAEIKARLLASGASGTLMSGSGSTICGFFDSEAARVAAQNELQTMGWWCAPAHTIARSDYQVRLREVLA